MYLLSLGRRRLVLSDHSHFNTKPSHIHVPPLCSPQTVCSIALPLQSKSVILSLRAITCPAISAVRCQESVAGHTTHVKLDLHKQCCSITYSFFPPSAKKKLNERCWLKTSLWVHQTGVVSTVGTSLMGLL